MFYNVNLVELSINRSYCYSNKPKHKSLLPIPIRKKCLKQKPSKHLFAEEFFNLVQIEYAPRLNVNTLTNPWAIYR